ncbi:alginate export family protein [Dyella psychrodurans]|uniref:Alginate export family protein n=2 Tax=Dyella psychrodurans TaxID=1927960 RepID=A0A370X7I8_9GAMM|nr:alginate export family protein [Dyella psychrodurans]
MACTATDSSMVADQTPSVTNAQPVPQRPAINFYRWEEDWSVLADPRIPREPGDALKYIPLSSTDPESYLSLGLTVRERFVSTDPPMFGVTRGKHQDYLLHRLELHADAHITADTRVFVQLENALAPWLQHPTPVDVNRLDLRLFFLDTKKKLGDGEFKLRVGRQEIAFDLQRFVSVRDGPNVRQAYDAIWADYETRDWRFTGFTSQPVQYRNQTDFDDFSNRHLTFSGVRAQRRMSATSELSVSFSEFRQDNVHFLAATGDETRKNVDVHYNGTYDGLDWDIEGMHQDGSIGPKDVNAWAFGSLSGYTLSGLPWAPRIGLQWDAASGDHNLSDNHVGTFNPLFPNGYYVTLSGYTGYTNFIHVKPSLTLKPLQALKLIASVGLLWRQTTHDAIYVQPDLPVPGTAGEAGKRSSTYGQLQATWNVSRSLSFDAEFDRYWVAEALRRAGGHDSDFFELELRWGW